MSSPIRIVGTFNYEEGKFVSVDKNRRDFNRGKAVQIPAKEIANFYPINTNSTVLVGGAFNHATLVSGDSYAVKGGRRFIIEANKDRVLFIFISQNKLEIPQTYIQRPSGFHAEWVDSIRLMVANKLQATRVLAEWEVQFLVGAVAGLGWKGLALVVGVDIFEEVVTQKKSKAAKDVVKVLRVLGKSKKRLVKVAPVLESV